jgi:hypothetical protein
MAFEFAEGNAIIKVEPLAIRTEVRRAARAK